MSVAAGRRGPVPATTTTAVRLHCFPHAGGDAAAFRRWAGAVPGADVRCPPAGPEAASIAEEVLRWRAATPDRAGVYYGHSRGALVAYEAAAAAVADADQAPAAVVLGAPPAPGRPVDGVAGPVAGRLLRELEQVREHVLGRRRLPVPVVVLWGALDDVVPERDARAWVDRGGPGSRWVRLAHAGHLFHLSPGDEVRAALSSVLDRVAPVAA